MSGLDERIDVFAMFKSAQEVCISGLVLRLVYGRYASCETTFFENPTLVGDAPGMKIVVGMGIIVILDVDAKLLSARSEISDFPAALLCHSIAALLSLASQLNHVC